MDLLGGYTDRYFDEIFTEFDVDGSETVEKIEMINLIKKVLGIKIEEAPKFKLRQNLGLDIFRETTKSHQGS